MAGAYLLAQAPFVVAAALVLHVPLRALVVPCLLFAVSSVGAALVVRRSSTDRVMSERSAWAIGLVTGAYFVPWLISAVVLNVISWRVAALLYLPLVVAMAAVVSRLDVDKWLGQWRGNPKWWS